MQIKRPSTFVPHMKINALKNERNFWFPFSNGKLSLRDETYFRGGSCALREPMSKTFASSRLESLTSAMKGSTSDREEESSGVV